MIDIDRDDVTKENRERDIYREDVNEEDEENTELSMTPGHNIVHHCVL